ncbi:conjugal transfer protein TraP [Candidatus Hamiltonella defensa]|uniref:conjugal transfer protein TraP n=1 Tax=Candidatus Williamhamiltonella defendens TaxID=138072 RepID=UPI00158368BE|nr:conjugal transfer protein TraP [Candidatus Hamiltonella defensa]
MNETKDRFDFDQGDSEHHHASKSTPIEPTPPPESTSKKKIFLGLGSKEFVIFAFFMVLGGAWLFWPPPSEQPALARFASSQDVEEPAAFLKKDSEEKAIPSWNVNTQNNAALSEAFTRFQQEMALILEARRLFAEENREAMEALSARLDAKNQEIKQLKQQLGDMAIRFESHRTQKEVFAQKKAPQLNQKRHRPSSGTAGYHLHSLSQGMAWIAYKGSTYAVREGDTLGKLNIHKIDATKRQIDTSAGVIK